MTVNIIGLGYVGLTLAATVARAGTTVIGVESDLDRANSLAQGRSHAEDVANLSLDTIRPSLRLGVAPCPDASVTVFCVQTPITGEGLPDLGPLIQAIEQTAPQLQSGSLIVVESTVGPKDNEQTLLPRLAAYLGRPGTDFNYAYAPERVDPGRESPAYADIPRVVAGATRSCIDVAVRFYSRFFRTVVPAASLVDAEMAKLLENSYRLVNIALVNELARHEETLGFDIKAVTSLAATKPFGFQAFHPSAGAGGHCIPVDPEYLRNGVIAHGGALTLVERALEINQTGPLWTVEKFERTVAGLNVAGSVIVCGVAYKAGVADLRNSPALIIIELLLARGYHVCFWDPKIVQIKIGTRLLTRHTPGHCTPAAGILLHSTKDLVSLGIEMSGLKGVNLDPEFKSVCARIDANKHAGRVIR